jgi:hypothetical protein
VDHEITKEREGTKREAHETASANADALAGAHSSATTMITSRRSFAIILHQKSPSATTTSPARNPFVFFVLRAFDYLRVFVIQTLRVFVIQALQPPQPHWRAIPSCSSCFVPSITFACS